MIIIINLIFVFSLINNNDKKIEDNRIKINKKVYELENKKFINTNEKINFLENNILDINENINFLKDNIIKEINEKINFVENNNKEIKKK